MSSVPPVNATCGARFACPRVCEFSKVLHQEHKAFRSKELRTLFMGTRHAVFRLDNGTEIMRVSAFLDLNVLYESRVRK